MHEEGDIPELLGEPWLFLVVMLMVIALAVFTLSVATACTCVVLRAMEPGDALDIE
jgi:hypothetical protein